MVKIFKGHQKQQVAAGAAIFGGHVYSIFEFFEVKCMDAFLVCGRNKINLRALRKTAYIS